MNAVELKLEPRQEGRGDALELAAERRLRQGPEPLVFGSAFYRLRAGEAGEHSLQIEPYREIRALRLQNHGGDDRRRLVRHRRRRSSERQYCNEQQTMCSEPPHPDPP